MGLRMFSSTNLRRVILIESTMPATVRSKKCRPLRMSSSKPLILEGKDEERKTMFQAKAGVSMGELMFIVSTVEFLFLMQVLVWQTANGSGSRCGSKRAKFWSAPLLHVGPA